MRYMLILNFEESGWDENQSAEDMQAEMQRWTDYSAALESSGAHVAGDGLKESATARTVRISPDGERVVTDGPFAEAKEQVGGFYLIDVADDDAALEWAKKVPLRTGAIEVRPVMDYTQYGSEEPAEAKASA